MRNLASIKGQQNTNEAQSMEEPAHSSERANPLTALASEVCQIRTIIELVGADLGMEFPNKNFKTKALSVALDLFVPKFKKGTRSQVHFNHIYFVSY